jgi:uncharacterized membrane protein YecN with MAPEG domain
MVVMAHQLDVGEDIAAGKLLVKRGLSRASMKVRRSFSVTWCALLYMATTCPCSARLHPSLVMAGALVMCRLLLLGRLVHRLETRGMMTAADIMKRIDGHLWRGALVAAGGAWICGRWMTVPAVADVRLVHEWALMSYDVWPLRVVGVMTVAGARSAAGGMTAASRGVAVAAGHGDDSW